MAAFAIGVALGVVYFFALNTSGYAQALTPELASSGLQRLDTLFHAAVASMIVNYGTVSTGIDGSSQPLNYHVLSHGWIGFLSKWLGVPMLHAYYVIPHVVGVPLLLLSLYVSIFFVWRPAGPVRISPLAFVIIPVAMLWLVETKDWASYLINPTCSP